MPICLQILILQMCGLNPKIERVQLMSVIYNWAREFTANYDTQVGYQQKISSSTPNPDPTIHMLVQHLLATQFWEPHLYVIYQVITILIISKKNRE